MSTRIPISILDLSPTSQGRTRKNALDDSLELVQLAEQCGYRRYWMAEHHGSRTFMSSATSLLLTRAAEHTSTIRVGAGGVMLPNHTPLMVAEYYGTLATIYGDRIDLGLGRAPGTDPVTARALHRSSADLNDFADSVAQLRAYLGPVPDDSDEGLSGAEAAVLGVQANPRVVHRKVRAIPGEGTQVPLWMLGSSLGGAQVAAALGLPYSFASHFAPKLLKPAAQTYRAYFDAQAAGTPDAAPYLMPAVNVVVAPTKQEADYLMTTQLQAQSGLIHGRLDKLAPPREDWVVQDRPIPKDAPGGVDPTYITGAPEQVVDQLEAFAADVEADELMVVTNVWDPTLRRRSYELLAQAWV
ncbi:LLM class flavin-dependent oxidoreductase [Gleimia hominis]|uniref:LLM class flavin-dependent oxidoreductase n=1 Tax=Gleimia hominis TaxID=595468 RepID=A0ABU3I8W4_9ACTO|nr:LLM class flavin-dependent oxidoreductase [Gleimia hominis]MDT3766812.1 LLM class flavin-dependent oxidoreductase [Gleimia hominis]